MFTLDITRPSEATILHSMLSTKVMCHYTVAVFGIWMPQCCRIKTIEDFIVAHWLLIFMDLHEKQPLLQIVSQSLYVATTCNIVIAV